MAAAKHGEESAAPCSCCPSLAVCPMPSQPSRGSCCLWSALHEVHGSLGAPLGWPASTSWILLLKQGPWAANSAANSHAGSPFRGKNPFPHSAATCMGCSRRQHASVSRAALGERQILISFSSICSEIALRPVFCRTWSVLNLLPPALSQRTCLAPCSRGDRGHQLGVEAMQVHRLPSLRAGHLSPQ